MNITLFLIMSVALLLAAVLTFTHKPGRGLQQFANSLLVNITPKGRATRLADASFTQRYLLAKAGSDASHIAICTASDIPIGVVPDMTPVVDQANSDLSYPLPVNFLGLNEDTERMIASGAISVGATVIPAAGGLIRALPASGAGTVYVVGRAVSAATASGDQVEIIPCFPYAVTN